MGKISRKNKIKDPINDLKNMITKDANNYLISAFDTRLGLAQFNIFQVLHKLVRKTEALDNIIKDSNDQIGIYMDDIEFRGIDYKETIEMLKYRIIIYQQFATENKLEATYTNLQKIKDYSDSNSIYG